MAAVPWEGELPGDLKKRFGDAIREAASYQGQKFLVVRPEAIRDILEWLKREADFDYLVDITAVDWPIRDERFDLVYILYSFSRNERLRIKTSIPDGYRPESVVSVHRTANWLEREVFDMFGIEFANHPDLRRILMPNDWKGSPLRKDYPLRQQDQQWVQENLGIESGQ
jgi:NADH-quinone oxidoreductase subunit C